MIVFFVVGLRAPPVVSETIIKDQTMTIRTQPENILDKILKIFGKERKVVIPEGTDAVYNKLGPYVQVKADREGFFKALFGKKQ